MKSGDTRAMPANLESERVILGAILLDNNAIGMAKTLTPDDFYGDANTRIFQAMLKLAERSDPIDAVTIGSELGDEVERAGGHEYLSGLVEGLPRDANVEHHAGVVKTLAADRSELLNARDVMLRQFGSAELHIGEKPSAASLLDVAGLASLKGASTDDVSAALRRACTLLADAGADDLLRRTVRDEAVKRIKDAGVVPAPAGLVDAALGQQAAAHDDDGRQGSALALADPKRWPEPVDGAALLGELAQTFVRYIVLVDGAATTLPLWVVFAHAHDAAAVSPLLALTSPEKRCGKTTLLTLLSALVPRPLPTSSISVAALFRAVEKYKPTLLVDEADTFLADRDDLRCVLNAGHTRATAYTVRCAGDDHDVRAFSTWAPKAIAMIGRLPDTLEDRAVLVPMRRRAPGEKVERLRFDRLADLEPLRRKAARWAFDNIDALRQADAEVPDGMGDRMADNWRPLLAIADAAGGDWPERARKAAKALSGGTAADDGSVRTLLLGDLRTMFNRDDADRLASALIVEHLIEMEERPWPEWRRGEPLTQRGLACLLDPFGVRPQQLWIDGRKTRGYKRADLVEPWRWYLTDSETPARPPDTPCSSGRSGRSSAGTDFAPNDDAVGGDDPTPSEIRANPCPLGILPDLPATDPGVVRGTLDDDSDDVLEI